MRKCIFGVGREVLDLKPAISAGTITTCPASQPSII